MTRRNTNTPSSNTGPTNGYGGSGYYYFAETSSPRQPGDEFTFGYDGRFCTQLGQLIVAVEFYYHMYGASMGSMSMIDQTSKTRRSEEETTLEKRAKEVTLDIEAPEAMPEAQTLPKPPTSPANPSTPPSPPPGTHEPPQSDRGTFIASNPPPSPKGPSLRRATTLTTLEQISIQDTPQALNNSPLRHASVIFQDVSEKIKELWSPGKEANEQQASGSNVECQGAWQVAESAYQAQSSGNVSQTSETLPVGMIEAEPQARKASRGTGEDAQLRFSADDHVIV